MSLPLTLNIMTKVFLVFSLLFEATFSTDSPPYPFPKQVLAFTCLQNKSFENTVGIGENTAGKGKIARYEQFLLFPQCFQNTCTANKQISGLVWKRVDGSANII